MLLFKIYKIVMSSSKWTNLKQGVNHYNFTWYSQDIVSPNVLRKLSYVGKPCRHFLNLNEAPDDNQY